MPQGPDGIVSAGMGSAINGALSRQAPAEGRHAAKSRRPGSLVGRAYHLTTHPGEPVGNQDCLPGQRLR
jgi:hypothetical protein